MRAKNGCPRCGGPANRYGWAHGKGINGTRDCPLLGTSRIFYYREAITNSNMTSSLRFIHPMVLDIKLL